MILRHLIFIFAVLLPFSAQANRVALLVGHANYARETKLSVINSAANDVRGVRDVLVRSLGFNAAEVKVLTDPSREELATAIGWFEQISGGAETAVFYYSGHGVSDPLGENYMLPVRGSYDTLSGVQVGGIGMSHVVEALRRGKPRKSLLIFDACRSVVLAKSGVGKGLAGMSLPVIENHELIVHFAAQPNRTADDGTTSGYSPYTYSLLKFLPSAAEMGLQDLLDSVRDDVTRNSRSGQRPQRFGEIASNTVLVGNARPELARTTALQPVPRQIDREQEAWAEIQSSSNITALQAFLTEFPNGNYASRARLRIANLKPTLEDRLASPPQAQPFGQNVGNVVLGANGACVVLTPQRTWAPASGMEPDGNGACRRSVTTPPKSSTSTVFSCGVVPCDPVGTAPPKSSRPIVERSSVPSKFCGIRTNFGDLIVIGDRNGFVQLIKNPLVNQDGSLDFSNKPLAITYNGVTTAQFAGDCNAAKESLYSNWEQVVKALQMPPGR